MAAPTESSGTGGDSAAPRRGSSGGAKPTMLTLDDFRGWTATCRLRMFQQAYEDLVKTAQENDRTVQEELKAQGGLNTFRRSCRQFPLNCKPSDLAELGSGFVLYFHLLRYMVLMLLALALLQIPVVVAYGGKNSLTIWSYHNWQRMYDLHTQPCACIGNNDGVNGPLPGFQNASYGTSCAAWDLEWCQQGTAGPYSSQGKWCCRSWCFADPICPQSGGGAQPSMGNVRYQGMVRAVTTCQQEQQEPAFCQGLPDTAFDAASQLSVQAGEEHIENAYLTPGNYGPEQSRDDFVLLMYFICVLVLSLSTIFMRQHQVMTDKWVDAMTAMPCDFAVLVKGLPQTATDERAIMEFFKKNAVTGQETEVVKVVIGWNAVEFQEQMKELKKLQGKLRKLSDSDPQVSALKDQIQEQKAKLNMSDSSEGCKLTSSGTVVVVFRWSKDLRACLEKWDGLYAHLLNCDFKDMPCLPQGNGLLRGPQLPRFSAEDSTSDRLVVRRAPNPGDINWEELGATNCQKFKLLAVTNVLMLALTVGSFFATWRLNLLQEDIKTEIQAESSQAESNKLRVLSLIPAGAVSLVNVLLSLAARLCGSKEYQDTYTEQEFSQGIKMTMGMLINTAGVILWINLQPREWYDRGGLVEDLIYMQLIDAVAVRFCLGIDCTYPLNFIFRCRLGSKKLREWNEVIARNDKAELEEVRQSVEEWKYYFEPEEIDNPMRYARAITTFLSCVFYAPLFPACVLIGAVGLVLQYSLDKLLLLRWYKRPHSQNAMQAIWSLKVVKFLGPLFLSLGCLIFLTPSWQDRQRVQGFFFLCLLVVVPLCYLPSKLWGTLLGIRCCMPASRRSFRASAGAARDVEDYYQAQHLWPKHLKYHTDNFVYKALPLRKNPELLEPGSGDAVIESEDLKGVYAQALQDATSKSTDGRRRRRRRQGAVGVARAGHQVVCLDVSLVSTSAEAPAAVAKDPAALDGVMVDTPSGKWEWEKGSGFVPFEDACQADIEEGYQRYQAEGASAARITVTTSVGQLSVDFQHMTQMPVPSGRRRNIRRVE